MTTTKTKPGASAPAAIQTPSPPPAAVVLPTDRIADLRRRLQAIEPGDTAARLRVAALIDEADRIDAALDRLVVAVAAVEEAS